MYSISAQSKEYVRVPVAASFSGVAQDPTVAPDVVAFAIIPQGASPVAGDFHTGDWETDSTTTPPTYYARLLVGPGGGAVTLTADTTYDVWLRVTDNPEVPVRLSGSVRATA